ncbi:WXG100 family type VII secretion target [Micromonospora sp. NPDC005806]|uniref:WXG100 family type VII secretion target n=1 Tax=Micromonospora sp. NPDC005806 TaxID=3364234 RepID=UPI0036C88C99
MSEYTQRYEHVSHKELYHGVTSGDPKQVDSLSAQWSSLKDTLEGLGRDLTGDLEALAKTWTGDASREFQQRLNLVVDYSGNLAEGMAGIRQALDMMASELRTAQSKTESPEETDDNDKLLSGAAKGFLVGGLPGAVIGGVVGHEQDQAEQEKAHQRMVKVVADLAEGYDFSAYGRIVVPEEPDNRLPGHSDPPGSSLKNGPSVGTPSGGPNSGTFGPGAGTGQPGAGQPGSVGSIGTVDPTGTSLAGAAPPLTSTGPMAGLPTNIAGGPSTVPTAGGNSLLGLPGVGTGSLAGSNTPTSGRIGGMENRAAAGTGRLAGGRGLVVEAEGRSNGGRGTSGRPAMAGRNGVLGKHGEHDEDESDERFTWLTEDEMVWGDGRSAPPPVLGGTD